MQKTKVIETESLPQLSVSRRQLPIILGCGQATADKIAKEAEARFCLGKRVLIFLPKIQEYLNHNCQ